MVRFTGPDVDLLLANKAEMLLALEQLTMEMLRMTQDEHSMLQFDANDYRAFESKNSGSVRSRLQKRSKRAIFRFTSAR